MNMKELRQRAGVKAEEVVFRLGVSMSTLRNWEQGRTVPNLTPAQYLELITLYKCTAEELAAATPDQSTKN